MTMDLEDLGEFHIVIDISVRASIQQVFCIYYGLGVPLNAENSSMNKGDKNIPAHMKLIFWWQERGFRKQ